MNTQAVASPVKAATRMDNPASKIPYTFCLSMILSFLLLWFPGGDPSRANRFFYPISYLLFLYVSLRVHKSGKTLPFCHLLIPGDPGKEIGGVLRTADGPGASLGKDAETPIV